MNELDRFGTRAQGKRSPMPVSIEPGRICHSTVYRLASLVSLATLILLVGSCIKVGPHYSPPETPVSQEHEWIDIDAPRVNAEAAELTRWWTVFEDPVLDSLVETAYGQNLTLRTAGLRVLTARANLGIAVGAKYPQSQQINGRAARVEVSESEPDALFAGDDFEIAELTFDLGWEIDFWGRFRRAIEAESAQLDASIAAYDDVMVTLAAEVARTYVQIRTLEQRLALARANVEIQEGALRIADVRFQNGVVTELDVTQATTVLSTTQASIPPLQAALRQSENALAVLLGQAPQELGALLDGTAPIPSAPPEVSMGVPAELLRRRPDVRRAERQLAAQSARIGVAVSDLYPRLSLVGSVGFRSSDLTGDGGIDDVLSSDNLTGFLGPFFSWNVFNYGRIKNNIRVQDARFQQLLVGYQQTVLSALAETESALVAYLQAHDRATYLDQSVAASRRSLDLSLIQYREGTVDFNRVLNSLDSLSRQQDALSSASGDIATNLITMYKALGGGYEPGVQRDVTDYVADEDQEQLRSRTRYWRKQLPANE